MEKIEKLFVSLEVAQLARKVGFCVGCLTSYNQGNLISPFWDIEEGNDNYNIVLNSELIDEAFAAPTPDQLLRWLREQHRLIIQIELDQTSDMKFVIEVCYWLTDDELNLVENEELPTRFRNIDIPQELWGYYRDYDKALNQAFILALNYLDESV